MIDFLIDKPMLRIALMVMCGIAIGGSLAVPFWVPIVLLVLASALRKVRIASSLLLLCTAFSLGLFLISNSNRHNGAPAVPLPYADRVEEWMQERREQLLMVYQEQGIQGDEYSVLAAMTLGERSKVDKTLKESYNVSGATHVFALSGMHLGIIFMILSILIPTTGMSWIPVLMRLLFIWAYVMLVGCHASILRAATMLSVYSFCDIMSRKAQSIDVLVFTALLLLIIFPQWLFDVGFQMSFMAMLSISLLFPKLDAKVHAFEFLPLRYFIRITVLSFCASLGVAPLIALYFHRISVYSLLINILISPLALIIISLALLLFFCVLVSNIFSLTPLVSWFLIHAVRLQNDYLRWTASLPGASIDNVRINTAQTTIIYILIIAVCTLIYMLFRRSKK